VPTGVVNFPDLTHDTVDTNVDGGGGNFHPVFDVKFFIRY
jgi:hypothetical protein